MSYFIDVILPIPIEKTFIYAVNRDEAGFLKMGMRVAVPFGKSKVYAGVVYKVHQIPPTTYEAKDIEYILDESPIISPVQMELWQWIASYYLCTIGEVMRAALPAAFLLESETRIALQKHVEVDEKVLSDDAFVLIEALHNQSEISIAQVMDILGKRNVLPVVRKLMDAGYITMREELYEQYKPKIISYISIAQEYQKEERLHEFLDTLSRAPKQHKLVMTYFMLSGSSNKPVKSIALQKTAQATSSTLQALVKKGVFELYEKREDRVYFDGETGRLKTLNAYQKVALQEIKTAFESKNVCLLHGVTASGKTEVYVELIQELLDTGQQILYLLPEIALTTQLITRLQAYFGDKIAVFHSKYSVNERVEVYHNVINQSPKAQIVIGARSAVLLPFQNLGLIVVDEEHERSFKQFDPAPRYHARDAAIVLGQLHQAKVLLGSATPSLETYTNAKQNKYGLVTLSQRYANILMPEINLVDIKEKHRKKMMTGHFSDTLLRAITDAFALGEQVILFQNRRGYAPILECTICGHAPQCPNCDVSLTYHKYRTQLRCHYCSHSIALQEKCMACGSPDLTTKGFGTEQIEDELKVLYPEKRIARMDSDTTRGKFGFQKLIAAFEQEDIDILVGTQMLTKGLDFRNVSLVGILNADAMLNLPDFRAHERSYQLIAQVSGRAGRTEKQGKVLVQTYNPYHQILQQVSANRFEAMVAEQLDERYQFKYPPFYRLIKITLKHRDYQKIEESSQWLGQALRQVLGAQCVLGPEAPPIARIRNQYHRHIMIKLSRKRNLKETKNAILRVRASFQAIGAYRSVRVVLDVDPQ